MPITWTPAIATGVRELDDEHKELFRQVNKLTEAMKSGKGRDAIEPIVAFLQNYVVEHFAHEEKYMDEVRCPVASANRQAHAAFLKKFGELRKQIAASGVGPTVVLEVSDYLEKWLVDHIKKIDTTLQECVVPV